MFRIIQGVMVIGCLLWCLLVATAQSTAKTAGWKADASKAAIPQHPASGRIHGQKFTVEKVEISGSSPSYFMHMRQGKDFFADREFVIFLRTHQGETLSGKFFVVHPGSLFHQPSEIQEGNTRYPALQGVHMSYKVANDRLPKTEMFSEGFTLRLQFGKAHGDRLPGGIYLAMSDKAKSFVAGTFTAVLTK